MNNDLREQIAYKLIKIHKLGRVGADFDDKEANELITLISTATLEWIPVSERLPDDMDNGLIVYYENDVASAVSNCDSYLSHLGFCIMHEHRLKPIVGVTHWMPLPEPPSDNLRGRE